MPGIDGIEAARLLREGKARSADRLPDGPRQLRVRAERAQVARGRLSSKARLRDEVTGALRRALASAEAGGEKERSSRADATRLERPSRIWPTSCAPSWLRAASDGKGLARYAEIVGGGRASPLSSPSRAMPRHADRSQRAARPGAAQEALRTAASLAESASGSSPHRPGRRGAERAASAAAAAARSRGRGSSCA